MPARKRRPQFRGQRPRAFYAYQARAGQADPRLIEALYRSFTVRMLLMPPMLPNAVGR